MNYTVVFKNGSVRRFIGIEYCDIGVEYIALYCINTQGHYEIRKKDIASVVFYP